MRETTNVAAMRPSGLGPAGGILGPLAILVHAENAERAVELLADPTDT